MDSVGAQKKSTKCTVFRGVFIKCWECCIFACRLIIIISTNDYFNGVI